MCITRESRTPYILSGRLRRIKTSHQEMDQHSLMRDQCFVGHDHIFSAMSWLTLRSGTRHEHVTPSHVPVHSTVDSSSCYSATACVIGARPHLCSLPVSARGRALFHRIVKTSIWCSHRGRKLQPRPNHTFATSGFTCAICRHRLITP